ncbi:unnamed protein product [Darwinula stevensoni]|uniref:Uncharacterized protein n=1 Tax=Darwinula stevensoni TaxID=69355 RepID=A0A7R9ACM5_9CRUS|nr:unnamed protein product [Darwinula stevensoni]CAG0900155.1 unnamed protein product [Darwinula stevensoni]
MELKLMRGLAPLPDGGYIRGPASPDETLLRERCENGLCPEPQYISPCTCSDFEESENGTVDCSDAETTASIFDTFNNASWSSTELMKFRLSESKAVLDLSHGIFGNITFQRIYTYKTTIRTIHPSTLNSSRERLQSLNIWNSRLEDFPFTVLPELTNLKILDLHGNALKTVPPLESESLKELYLYDNQIATFQGNLNMPNLKSLNIAGHADLSYNYDTTLVVRRGGGGLDWGMGLEGWYTVVGSRAGGTGSAVAVVDILTVSTRTALVEVASEDEPDYREIYSDRTFRAYGRTCFRASCHDRIQDIRLLEYQGDCPNRISGLRSSLCDT